MNISISDSDLDKEAIEREWESCVYMIYWVRSQDKFSFPRYEILKRYWEERLKLLVPIIYTERVGWLKDLEAKYPSGIDWRSTLDEVLKV